MADRILLIGMMGAGKTTIGRLLAERLGWRYLDSDAEIERRTGKTVREIFESEGEAAFRALESEVLRDAVRVGTEASVISVAGGAVLDPANRTLISEAGHVVWLRAPVRVLAARAANGAHRPLLDGDAEAALARLYTQREPLYTELADLTIDTGSESPEHIADTIRAAVG